MHLKYPMWEWIVASLTWFYVYDGGGEELNNLIKPNDQLHMLKLRNHSSLFEFYEFGPLKCCYMRCYSLLLVILRALENQRGRYSIRAIGLDVFIRNQIRILWCSNYTILKWLVHLLVHFSFCSENVSFHYFSLNFPWKMAIKKKIRIKYETGLMNYNFWLFSVTFIFHFSFIVPLACI